MQGRSVTARVWNRYEFALGCSKMASVYRRAINDRPYIS